MENVLNKLINYATEYTVKIICSILILVIGFKLINVLEKYLKKEHKFSKLDPSVKGFIISFVTIVLKILLFIIVLSVLGIPMTSLITILGSCALAVGLSLQGGLSNLAGGLMILVFKPFIVGDYIEADGKEGKVKSITLFYTTIISVDNKYIQLPNGKLSNSDITNYTASKTRRVDMEICVAYNTDDKKLKKVISDIIKDNKLILKDEETTFRLINYGDSSLNYTLRVWAKTEDYWTVYFDLKEKIKQEFDKNNIEIPFPQLSVHLNKIN